MNRTARRIRTISAATLALTAAGLTLGSITAATAAPLPLPAPPSAALPTVQVRPTFPPAITAPPATIKPGLVGMITTVNAPVGPVARGSRYSYSMTVEMKPFGTRIVTFGHGIPSQLTDVSWTCSASAGANCGGSNAGSRSIFAVLTTPVWSTVTFVVSGTVAFDATSFALSATTFTSTVQKHTVEVAVHVPTAMPS